MTSRKPREKEMGRLCKTGSKSTLNTLSSSLSRYSEMHSTFLYLYRCYDVNLHTLCVYIVDICVEIKIRNINC